MDNEIEELLEDIVRKGETADAKADELLFKELARVEGFKDFLARAMAKDIRQYFTVSKELQDTVRGRYLRTEYLYKRLLESSK